jgi:hypothetical protein
MIGRGQNVAPATSLCEDTRETILARNQAPCLPAQVVAVLPYLMERDHAWSSMQGHGPSVTETEDAECTVGQHRLIVEHWADDVIKH